LIRKRLSNVIFMLSRGVAAFRWLRGVGFLLSSPRQRMASIFHVVTLSLGSPFRLHRTLPPIPSRAWGGDRHRETRYSVEMTYRPLYKPLTDQERAEIRARFDQQVRETEAVEAHYIIQRRPMKNGVRMRYATCPNCGTAFHWPRTGGLDRYNREKAFAHIAECIGRNPAARPP